MTKEPTAAQTVEQIAAEAVRLMHERSRLMHLTSEVDYLARAHVNGRLHGLRWTLCLLNGWNPVQESGPEERADRFLRVWHSMPGHCTEGSCPLRSQSPTEPLAEHGA